MPVPPSPRTWTSIAATSALVIALASGSARAQSAEAEALFNDGVTLLKQASADRACDAFEASNRIEPRAGTLIRLGECREQLHQLASAWSAYKDALTRVKDPRKQKLAQARIASIEPRLSHLTIVVPDIARIAGLALARDGKAIDPGLWNLAIPINGGTYTITATAPDHATWTQTVTVAIERGQASLSVPALEHAAAAGASTQLVPAPATASLHDEPAEDGDHPRLEPAGTFTTKREVAIGVLAVGVGAAVSGALLGRSANTKRDDAYALCPDPATPCARADDANSLISAAHTRAYEADAAFAIGSVAAIVAGTLWFTGGPEHAERVGVTANVSGSSGSLVFVGKF